MRLQRWEVYRKEDENKQVVMGSVVTSIDAKYEIALDKAYHKYVGRPYTIGYSVHVRKTEEVTYER
jgi:hypothetical protein